MKYSLTLALSCAFACVPALASAQTRDLLNQTLPAPPAAAAPLDGIKQEAARQDKGDFGDLRQIPPAGAIQRAWDKVSGQESVLWARDPNKRVQKMRLREGMTTTFWLPSKEPIEEFVLADNENFGARICNKTPNCLFLWPKNTGFDSNITIITKKAAYPFYFRSTSIDSAEVPHLKVMIGAQGPESGPDAAPAAAEPGRSSRADRNGPAETVDAADAPEWVANEEYDPSTIAFDIEMKGDKEIAPVNLWRDSRFTWLDYNDKRDPKDWPAVWRVVDGVDEPVRIRKTKDNRFLVVEATGPLTLIKGEKVVCIRPKS